MLNSFSPIIDNNSQILILGSLPSVISLRENEYYANPQNQFWNILFSVFGEEKIEEYDNKREFLLKHKIALWDIVKCAEREGSLDSAIQNETPNDIRALLREYQSISLIILNGTKAAQLFKRYFRDIDIKSITVPSTSPMRGKNVKSLDEKKELWEFALLRGMDIK